MVINLIRLSGSVGRKMTKYVVRLQCDKIKWFKVKKAERLMLSLHNRLYWNADKFYTKDKHSSDAIRVTPIDSNQVGMVTPQLINPDDVRATIMSNEISGTKKKGWLNLDSSKMWQYLVAIIIAGSLLYAVLMNGGF